MSIKLRARALICCAFLPGLHAQTSSTNPASSGRPPAVEDFFRNPEIFSAQLSPDGRSVAAIIDGDSGRVQLAVFDVERPSQAKVVAALANEDVSGFAWVNADRLVLNLVDRQKADRHMQPGLFAVNRDGSGWLELISASFTPVPQTGSSIASHVLPWQWRLARVLRDGSADVLVVDSRWNDGTRELINVNAARLDTLTGVRTNLSANAPHGVEKWAFDSHGSPIAVLTGAGDREVSYLKTGEGWSKWEDVARMQGEGLWPVGVERDGSLLVVGHGSSDFQALYRYDPVKRELAAQALVEAPGYDLEPSLVYDATETKLLGVRFEADAPGTVWFDPDMKAVQDEVDKKLPGSVNRIQCQPCGRSATVLVTTVSDRSPPTYLLYRRETRELRALGAARPWIDPRRMGQRDMFRFKARDGLSIPVLVTRPDPKSTEPGPAVVLVHGGPYLRGTHWGWEPQAQFLASRGYVVIEPEFRGSTGYGYKLFRAGWKQWGLGMQDDVADAVKWAVGHGWVDAGRVCIGGASYGGYAVLMGMIKTPELYRCGFEWVGVTDIDLLYSIHWSDASEAWQHYGMPVLIGDRVADARQFEETSPLRHADRLQQPLLMAYGASDRRVPIEHGVQFRDAVTRSNKNVEWIVYPEEGHGWMELKSNVDFWTRVEAFLARNIGAAEVQAKKAE